MSNQQHGGHEDYNPSRLYDARTGRPLPGNLYTPPERNNAALAGMIVGIASIFLSFLTITGIIGLVLSIKGYRYRDAAGNAVRRGMALAGIITSSVGILVGIYGIITLPERLAYTFSMTH
jgi:hypothetical protein